MLLHCTQALAKKLTAHPIAAVSQPLWCHWHAHLLRMDRRQCVLFSHDQTRYSLFVAGLRATQFADLGRWHRELFTAVLAKEGISDSLIEKVEHLLGSLEIDTRTDRSVLSGMRVAAQDIEFGFLERVSHVLLLDVLEVSRWLNERPVTVHGKFIHPSKLMRQALEAF